MSEFLDVSDKVAIDLINPNTNKSLGATVVDISSKILDVIPGITKLRRAAVIEPAIKVKVSKIGVPIEYKPTFGKGGSEIIIMVKRSHHPMKDKAYCTVAISDHADEPYWGHYDLTDEEARYDMDERAGWPEGMEP